jgi:hypothetical protein
LKGCTGTIAIKFLAALLYLFAALAVGCQSSATHSLASQSNQATAKKSTGNPFDDFLQTSVPPSDGFDFPFGDADGKGAYTDNATGNTHQGWYAATKFGEKLSTGQKFNHVLPSFNVKA